MITQFRGNYRWLSNFWPAEVTLDGVQYPTVEHAYQAAKSTNPEERLHILRAATPGEAKRLGRRVVYVRHDWAEAKLGIMEDLLRQKFRHPQLREFLQVTAGTEIVEGNEWGDTFWGTYRGEGENHLGRLLMKIRDEIGLSV
jgi:ribA/ribD-fused uncharacterized protein